MRDGKVIETSSIGSNTSKTLATKMLGRNLEEITKDFSAIKNPVNFTKNHLLDFILHLISIHYI